MRIARITAWAKTLPLAQPYSLAGGRLTFRELDSTFVRIDTDTGTVGWGESCPWGHTYLPAFGAGVRAALPLLAPALLGENPLAIDRLNRQMDTQLPGHPYAKSALDIALWDLAAQHAQVPLHQILGGASGDWVAANSSISTAAPQAMVASIEAARAAGYRTHSAKIGGADRDLDIARIEAIESATVRGESITFDINQAWTPANAIEIMNSVDANGWFEQPCATLEQCARVRRGTRQIIMLDECLHTFQDHLTAWRLDACHGVKVKPNRLGGLTKCRQVRDFGVAIGWQMHIEDTGGTILADTAALHLALATPAANRLASWLCHPHLEDDYATDAGARNCGGEIRLPDRPGIGVAPPADWLGEPSATFQ